MPRPVPTPSRTPPRRPAAAHCRERVHFGDSTLIYLSTQEQRRRADASGRQGLILPQQTERMTSTESKISAPKTFSKPSTNRGPLYDTTEPASETRWMGELYLRQDASSLPPRLRKSQLEVSGRSTATKTRPKPSSPRPRAVSVRPRRHRHWTRRTL